MASCHGFLTATPDARYGDGDVLLLSNYIYVQSFALGDVGDVQLTEIGGYFARNGAEPNTFTMAVYTNDSTNSCPESLVANSVITVTASYGTVSYESALYTTKPQLSGNATYWIAVFSGASFYIDKLGTGAFTTGYVSSTYDTMIEGSGWHSLGTVSRDYGICAVYEPAAATSQFARPSSDVTGGTFRSILVTAPFGPRVIA